MTGREKFERTMVKFDLQVAGSLFGFVAEDTLLKLRKKEI